LLCFKSVVLFSAFGFEKSIFYFDFMMKNNEKTQYACDLLRKKFNELGRLPKKDDFSEIERARIKAYLGPWPRALEAAGLKEKVKSNNKKRKSRKTELHEA